MSRKSNRRKMAKRDKGGIWKRLVEAVDTERISRAGRFFGKMLLLGVLAAAVVGGFIYLDGYVHEISRQRDVSLTVELKDPPGWASEELIESVCLSTGIHRDDFILDEKLVSKWAANLGENPWVKKVNRLRKRYDGRLVIDCELRQPIASIQRDARIYYVDAEAVVLPALPLEGTSGHVVRLRGVRFNLPQLGESVDSAALKAGLEVLRLIREVDEQLPRVERLWGELAVMDVSNHEGRISSAEAHLVLYTSNDTEIRWGAAVGRSRPYYEAPAKIKLATLYTSYKRYRSLGAYEFIDLRDLRKEKADPVRRSG